MQTFLPYEDFEKTAKVLDWRRLGKQRVEGWQILKTIFAKKKGQEKVSWGNHPAVLMWEGSEYQLALYTNIIIKEWINRGYNDTLMGKIWHLMDENSSLVATNSPFWLGNKQFHKSHRQALLAKNYDHYIKYFNEEPIIDYYWPVRKN